MGGGRAWGEEPDTFSGGRNIGGKWEEGKERGLRTLAILGMSTFLKEGCLRKFSAEVGQVRASYTGRSLSGKGPRLGRQPIYIDWDETTPCFSK